MIGGHRFARQGEALVVCTGTVAATAEHRCGVEEWTYGKHTLICSDSAAADFGAIATLIPTHDTCMRHVVVVGVVAACCNRTCHRGRQGCGTLCVMGSWSKK